MTERPSRESSSELIDGRYRLLGLIAEGGMGRVYEAEHVDIGRRVALKILNPTLSEMEDVVARFRREARLATQIGNPHIVDVTDSGITESGRFYFVMEFLDGVELGSLVKRGPLDILRALGVARQIAEALSAAHHAGVIHRDLKPENIFLVERDGEPDFVKVLDFGIATTIAGDSSGRRLTQPGMAMGTPEYMAPEQAMTFTADARSDVYSLGAMLYEMVTGEPPYQGATFTQVLVQKANSDPRPPRELRGDLGEDLEALIVKMMAREPDARYQSMEDVAQAITSCVDRLATREHTASSDDRLFASVPVPPISTDIPADQVATEQSAGLNDDSWAVVERSLIAHASTVIAHVDVPEKSAPAPDLRVRRSRVALAVLLPAGLLTAIVTAYALMKTDSDREDAAPARAEAAQRAAIPDPPTARPARKSRAEPARRPRVESGRRGTAAKPLPGAEKNAPAQTAPIGPPPKTVEQARSLLKRAQAAAAHRNWDDARVLYGRIAKGRPLAEWGHLGLSSVALATGDTDAAIRHATAGLRAGGGLPARLALATALSRNGRFAAAIKQYRIVLRYEPRNREAKRGLEAAQRKRARK